MYHTLLIPTDGMFTVRQARDYAELVMRGRQQRFLQPAGCKIRLGCLTETAKSSEIFRNTNSIAHRLMFQ